MKESQHTGNAEQHRATPQQWLAMEVDSHCFAVASTILELRDRIEALESRNKDEKEAWAAMRRASSSQGERIGALMERIEDLENDRRAILDSSSRLRVGLHDSPAKPNHPEKPDSSLVERVAAAIHPNVCADPNLYLHEARAAIRAVAVWMTTNPDHHFPPALVFALDKEAER